MQKKHLEYLDIAEGIAIFLVVMGHVAETVDTPCWRLAVYTFHMPLFFLVSGIVVRDKGENENYSFSQWLQFLKKNVLTLLVPYLLWALIFLPFKFTSIPWIFYGSWAALNKIGTSTALWFLPCLFCARIMMDLILWGTRKVKYQKDMLLLLLAVISFAIGFLLPRPEIGFPLGSNIALIALGFMLIGNSFKDILALTDKKGLWIQSILFLCSAAAFAYGAYFRYGEKMLVGMFNFQYGELYWFFFNAISGCMTILMLSSMSAHLYRDCPQGKIRHFIVWLGQHTIGIYLLHLLIVRNLIVPALHEIGYDRISFFGAFVETLITLGICCFLMNLIEKYAPSLFGSSFKPAKDNTENSVSALLGNADAIEKMSSESFRNVLLAFEKKWSAEPAIPQDDAELLRRFAESATQSGRFNCSELIEKLAVAEVFSAENKEAVLKELQTLRLM